MSLPISTTVYAVPGGRAGRCSRTRPGPVGGGVRGRIRAIHLLADKALLAAFAQGARQVRRANMCAWPLLNSGQEPPARRGSTGTGLAARAAVAGIRSGRAGRGAGGGLWPGAARRGDAIHAQPLALAPASASASASVSDAFALHRRRNPGCCCSAEPPRKTLLRRTSPVACTAAWAGACGSARDPGRCCARQCVGTWGRGAGGTLSIWRRPLREAVLPPGPCLATPPEFWVLQIGIAGDAAGALRLLARAREADSPPGCMTGSTPARRPARPGVGRCTPTLCVPRSGHAGLAKFPAQTKVYSPLVRTLGRLRTESYP